MTPERLEHIRTRIAVMHEDSINHAWLTWASELSEYIDLLHEDLRITRAERDAEKAKNMALRKGQGTYHQENK